MGAHRGPRGRDKGQGSVHFGEGTGSLCHLTSAVWVQVTAELPRVVAGAGPVSSVAVDSPGSRQEGEWELGEF